MIIVNAVMHILEEGAEVFVQRVDNVEKDGEGGYGAVVLDLRDESFTNARLLGELFQGDIFLGSFCLDLIPDQQEELFIHIVPAI